MFGITLLAIAAKLFSTNIQALLSDPEKETVDTEVRIIKNSTAIDVRKVQSEPSINERRLNQIYVGRDAEHIDTI